MCVLGIKSSPELRKTWMTLNWMKDCASCVFQDNPWNLWSHCCQVALPSVGMSPNVCETVKVKLLLSFTEIRASPQRLKWERKWIRRNWHHGSIIVFHYKSLLITKANLNIQIACFQGINSESNRSEDPCEFLQKTSQMNFSRLPLWEPWSWHETSRLSLHFSTITIKKLKF